MYHVCLGLRILLGTCLNTSGEGSAVGEGAEAQVCGGPGQAVSSPGWVPCPQLLGRGWGEQVMPRAALTLLHRGDATSPR